MLDERIKNPQLHKENWEKERFLACRTKIRALRRS